MKKCVLLIISLILAMSVSISSVNALSIDNGLVLGDVEFSATKDDDFSHNCQDIAPTLRILGGLLVLVEVGLPLVLIVKSSLSLFKVVTSGKQDDIKSAVDKLKNSVIAAILIFFVPRIVDVAIGFVSKGTNSDVEICKACIFEPYSNTCAAYVDK